MSQCVNMRLLFCYVKKDPTRFDGALLDLTMVAFDLENRSSLPLFHNIPFLKLVFLDNEQMFAYSEYVLQSEQMS